MTDQCAAALAAAIDTAKAMLSAKGMEVGSADVIAAATSLASLEAAAELSAGLTRLTAAINGVTPYLAILSRRPLG